MKDVKGVRGVRGVRCQGPKRGWYERCEGATVKGARGRQATLLASVLEMNDGSMASRSVYRSCHN